MRSMTTADMMRKLIEQAGLSQRQAADQIGVTQRTFRNWCTGKSEPPRAVLMALELLAIKATTAGKLTEGQPRTKVRTDSPFTVYKVPQDTLAGASDLWGYTIDGPGADPSWLLTEQQVEPKLAELKSKLRR